VLHVFAHLFASGSHCLLGLFKHYSFKLQLAINFLEVALLCLVVLQFSLVFFNHSLLYGLTLLIQFKSLLFVDSQTLQLFLNLICDHHNIVGLKEVVLKKFFLLVPGNRLDIASVETASSGVRTFKVQKAIWVHQILNLESDDGVLCTFEERLSSLFFDFDDFFYHFRHLLFTYLQLIIFGVLFDFIDDFVIDRI